MVNFIVADLNLNRPVLLKLNIELFKYIDKVQKREDLDLNTVLNQTVKEYVEGTIESLMAFRSNCRGVESSSTSIFKPCWGNVYVSIRDIGAPSNDYNLLNTFTDNFADVPPVEGKRNYYKIKAKNAENTSDYSDEVYVDVSIV